MNHGNHHTVEALRRQGNRAFSYLITQVGRKKSPQQKTSQDIAEELAHMLVYVQGELRLIARTKSADNMRGAVLYLTEQLRRFSVELTGREL